MLALTIKVHGIDLYLFADGGKIPPKSGVFSTSLLMVERFHHVDGDFGPPLLVEFSTTFDYSV